MDKDINSVFTNFYAYLLANHGIQHPEATPPTTLGNLIICWSVNGPVKFCPEIHPHS